MMSNRLVFRAYTQLVRLPNVFTALADILLGALATGVLSTAWPAYLLLATASACMYCGGMVWNDYFDVEQDRRERPFRPLPSGRISRVAAAGLGIFLLVSGILFTSLAALRAAQPQLLYLSLVLVVLILLYDGLLKHTWSGPVLMGGCRFLNVSLGLWLGGVNTDFKAIHIPLVIGLYIVGVTWFARTEARTSNKNVLAAAAFVILAALILALPLPLHVQPGQASPLFPYLLVAFGFFIGFSVHRAIRKPTPQFVQAAVKRSVLGLIALDAVLATAWAGTSGLLILLLLPPALILGRRIYST